MKPTSPPSSGPVSCASWVRSRRPPSWSAPSSVPASSRSRSWWPSSALLRTGRAGLGRRRLFILLGALAYAEVAVLYPRAGGNYVFLREAYGRLAGFLWGWVEFWIIRAASLAALATIFTESLHDVLRNAAFQQAVGLPPGDVLGFWGQRASDGRRPRRPGPGQRPRREVGRRLAGRHHRRQGRLAAGHHDGCRSSSWPSCGRGAGRRRSSDNLRPIWPDDLVGKCPFGGWARRSSAC